jgi:hypothetical protein
MRNRPRLRPPRSATMSSWRDGVGFAAMGFVEQTVALGNFLQGGASGPTKETRKGQCAGQNRHQQRGGQPK